MNAGNRHPIAAPLFARGRHQGITVFELAVVIAVAVVLAVLAFVSSREVLNRTKIARIKEDHRQIARAMVEYRVTNSELPTAESGLTVLEKPSFLNRLPIDPFRKDGGAYVYVSTGNPEDGYLLISAGPDGRFDLPVGLRRFAQGLPPPEETTSQTLAAMSTGPLPSPSKTLTPEEQALLDDYLESAAYDPARHGTEAGDIITVVR